MSQLPKMSQKHKEEILEWATEKEFEVHEIIFNEKPRQSVCDATNCTKGADMKCLCGDRFCKYHWCEVSQNTDHGRRFTARYCGSQSCQHSMKMLIANYMKILALYEECAIAQVKIFEETQMPHAIRYRVLKWGVEFIRARASYWISEISKFKDMMATSNNLVANPSEEDNKEE